MKVFLIVLAVLAGIILLVALLLFFGRARIRIRYHERLRVVAYVCGIPIPILSNKEKPIKQKNLSRCRNPERVLKKELKKRKKAAQKLAKKALKKKQKAAERSIRKKQHKSLQPKVGLAENLEMILTILKAVRDGTRGKILVRIRKMQIRVATADAAKTAGFPCSRENISTKTAKAADGGFTCTTQAKAANSSENGACFLVKTILTGADGKIAAENSSLIGVRGKEKMPVKFSTAVKNPGKYVYTIELWSNESTPILHKTITSDIVLQ